MERSHCISGKNCVSYQLAVSVPMIHDLRSLLALRKTLRQRKRKINDYSVHGLISLIVQLDTCVLSLER